MPDGLQFLVPTKIAPIVTTSLLSWRTKARIGLEWFCNPPAVPRPDCSVAEFVAGHYGQEAVEYLAEPLLAGVYGGAPEMLSVSSVLPRFVEIESKYGSLSKGMLAERGTASTPGKGEKRYNSLQINLWLMSCIYIEGIGSVSDGADF